MAHIEAASAINAHFDISLAAYLQSTSSLSQRCWYMTSRTAGGMAMERASFLEIHRKGTLQRERQRMNAKGEHTCAQRTLHWFQSCINCQRTVCFALVVHTPGPHVIHNAASSSWQALTEEESAQSQLIPSGLHSSNSSCTLHTSHLTPHTAHCTHCTLHTVLPIT